MWCTQCRIAFSWNNGQIVQNTARIHNPHQFQWMRERGLEHEIGFGRDQRRPGFIGECGAMPPPISKRDVPDSLVHTIDNQANIQSKVFSWQNVIQDSHGHNTEMTDQMRAKLEHLQNDQMSRINYLKGTYPERSYKQQLLRNFNKASKIEEQLQVLDTQTQVIQELLIEFHTKTWPLVKAYYSTSRYKLEEAFRNLIRRACEIVDYSNEHLYRIACVQASGNGVRTFRVIDRTFRISPKDWSLKLLKGEKPDWKAIARKGLINNHHIVALMVERYEGLLEPPKEESNAEN